MQKGAIRCVKFTHAPFVDLLCVAEHINLVHLIDTRTFDKETLNLSSVASSSIDSHHVAGVAFSQNCKKLFVGLENELIEFEINMHERRSFPYGDLS